MLHFRVPRADGNFRIKSVIDVLLPRKTTALIGSELLAKAFDDMTAVGVGRKAGTSLAWLM